MQQVLHRLLAAGVALGTIATSIAAYLLLGNLAVPLALGGVGLVMTCMILAFEPEKSQPEIPAAGTAGGYSGQPGGGSRYSGPRDGGWTGGNERGRR